ncbi:MAG: bifunctional phosphoglucose/phosphomannose isomerase [Bacteroidia bacterium]|jgi:glucose/mannose-6-phosphate isomerase|nr:bifunctional phosphoglucose/phosphomannose isomerase [Bacteroidia bacterium]MBP7268866.1 bifunctional phosphoglucose/phosphomannose isomerase [Bacteroidia bacterium]MBP7437244.1 bifunctional phosphoglucose/phosphomannose isomerase [Bacteroidia bacterium]MBP7728684.1 bifunctional phosphoglucose/phosphomannose isomerase [Bacteroidia bacterium]MBP7772778.1 bifunctional phosphoglucose/phosphomannose isomerase [Bacteroidia bacterium]
MKDLVQRFPEQLEEALRIGEQASISRPIRPIRNVIITGLGGSGIGGTIVSEIIANECPVPVTVNKDYFLPAFTGPETLVIVSSYSGNTEETLQAMDVALEKGAQISCITSGGSVAERAREHRLDLVLIPGGNPPRSCLGYSLTQLFFILHKKGLIGGAFVAQLRASIDRMRMEEAAIKSEAQEVTDFLFGKLPVIYAVDGYNGVATRFRQQINENSKMLCWHHIIPEMNHNELVGWAEQHEECAVVILRNSTDYYRSQARIEINKEIIAQRTPHIREIWSRGDSMLERSLYLVHLTDWVSCYLADRKAIDAVEVNVINHLKGSLAKLGER